MPTEVNVRPAKKPSATEEKTAKNDHKLSEESLEILKNFNKFDTIEKFYNLEDRIAMNLTHEKLYEQSMEQYSLLREVLESYIGGQKIENSMITNMAKIRRLARLSHYATSQLRKESAEQLEIVDAKLLQLQNTTSELQHIRKEIDRCLDYSAGDEELDLISVKEFYETAPDTISKPEETKEDEHKQYLARLQFESEQRKAMQSTLQELEGRRNVLMSDIHKKEQRIESVIPHINTLVKTTQPLQEILSVQFEDVEKVHEQRSLAVQLPTHLSVIYTHSLAYSEIMEDKSFTVRIIESENSVKEEPEDKRMKKENESITDRIEKSAAKIFDNHPLSVELKIGCGDHNVILTFFYLPELQVVTAKWEFANFKSSSQVVSSENLMTELFEHDDGVECPNSTGNIKMQHLKLNFNEISKKLGRPYKFAQVLGGLMSEESHLTEYLRKLVVIVRKRVENRLELDDVLSSIESKKSGYLGIPASTEFKLSSFVSCEDEKFISQIPESLSSKISTITGFYYQADFENADKSKKLTAWIVIPVNYPISKAILDFTSNFEGIDMQNLEATTIDLDLKSQLLNVALFKS